jgi:hypothetical protein
MTTQANHTPRTCLVKAMGATVMSVLGFAPVYAIAVGMFSGLTL